MDISKEVNFIWNIADKLRGAYTSDKYKDVIIPMVILRRFECALADTKNKVLEKYNSEKTAQQKC
ncbi:type I restriction-modification system subunit M N-terminal domain-containing protein [Campylobacter lanienae]|uniref:type I restriction-modification system subunit M N-terminal domain-containing protein n=1 Tax=Campylobacter lanienae TaxID=75658 RepID=UPI00191C712C|nr:type I restriction-modification system subunit M N-terminal domain-containing protein [Campylobacter lanienae]